MKYMVMECFYSYCILMDENGKFFRAANLHYQVGQTVTNPVLQRREYDKKEKVKRITSMFLAAACILLLLTGCGYTVIPFGSITISINPQVRLSVNHSGQVVTILALNTDGEALIEGVNYRFQPAEQLALTLADRAIELEYLHEGDTLILFTNSQNKAWKQMTERDVKQALTAHLSDIGSFTVMTEAELASSLATPMPDQSGYSIEEYSSDPSLDKPSSDQSSSSETVSKEDSSKQESSKEESSKQEISSKEETSSKEESSHPESQSTSSLQSDTDYDKTDYDSSDTDDDADTVYGKSDYDTSTKQDTDDEDTTDYESSSETDYDNSEDDD